MGKFVSISEGNTGRIFNAKKLKTSLSGGGECLWVPADSVELTTKTINKNGKYYAADDGKYGYSSVTVDAYADSVIGTGPDGYPYIVTDLDGDLDVQPAPEAIKVVRPPRKTNYEIGETMDYSGMVVRAYDVYGNVWGNEKYPNGIIPFEELIVEKYARPSNNMSMSHFLTDDYALFPGYDGVVRCMEENLLVERLKHDIK